MNELIPLLAIAVSVASIVGSPNAYSLAGTCGNGDVETGFGEQCDDVNFSNGDGCSDLCQIETGWECSGEPSTCTLIPIDFVAGEGIPIDNSALLLAGAQTNALWLLSLIGSAVVIGVVLATKKFR